MARGVEVAGAVRVQHIYAPYLEDITAIAFISSKYESLTRKIHFIPSKISSGSFQCNKLDDDWSNMYISHDSAKSIMWCTARDLERRYVLC